MAINLVKSKNECCGCTACMNICPKHAIKMEEDEEGFLYPKIDDNLCINCGLCEKTCAFQHGYKLNSRLNKMKVYAIKNKSTEVRDKSTSGGIFYEIANNVLKNNGVIYGVVFDENFHTKHTRTDNIDGIKKMMGSKYSQSELGDTYTNIKNDLKNGKEVLFTGTPCQVGGIIKYLQNVDTSKLILVDIVCHGIPSPKLFKEYISFLENKKGKKVTEYYHRSKINGWNQTEEVRFNDEKLDFKSRLSQTWKRIFYTDLALRPSCYNCKYTNTERPGDITIGDFWGIELFNPEFADNKGVSLVMVNTEKGNKILEKIKDNLIISNQEIEKAIIKNPQIKEPTKVDQNKRKIFWNDYKNKGFNYIAKKYGGYNTIGKIKNLAKRILKK